MTTGKVIFIHVGRDDGISVASDTARAVADADIVIWTTGVACDALLRNVGPHADLVEYSQWSAHTILPFYSLASQCGLLIADIRSSASPHSHTLADQLERCHELGLATEVLHATG